MTNDEMIELAKKAGVLLPTYQGHIEHMMRFAELVAAKEREACIAAVTEMRNTADSLMEGLDQIGRVLSDRMEAFEDVIEQLQARGNK